MQAKPSMNSAEKTAAHPSGVIPQFRSFVDKTDYANLSGVFENHHIAEGPYALQFEMRLLDLIGARYGAFATSGTTGLYLALRALGIGPADEVIVQNVTFIASANAVEMTGARPVFADVLSYKDLTIDLNKVRPSKKTKALVLAHLYGTANSNTEEVAEFCRKHGIYLVEDAAQALGVSSKMRHLGTFGRAGVFSFYADKTITTGEGGFVVTGDPRLFERMQYLRNQGRKKSGTFIHPEIGYNFRITDIQAALGLSQLDKLPTIIREKRMIYDAYRRWLKDSVEFLEPRTDYAYIPFRVVIFVRDAEKTMAYMARKGIEPRSLFYPLHRQPCYRHLGCRDGDFENSNLAYHRGICLPTWIGLAEEQIRFVSQAVMEAEKLA
ncbi:MAG: DegT/DnrJ/EryC1/StrS family aminotransferase [Nitrospiraceae bacterium]|nr:DegT/DnrJ/EryC1/StrS family aminotransferase [Nitrospiraceae bacterium]